MIQLINHNGHIRAHGGNDVEYPVADVSNVLPDEERNKYGNLFAAAPDLLKALEGCMFSLAMYKIKVEGEEKIAKSKTLMNARNAIKKAENNHTNHERVKHAHFNNLYLLS